jgi:SHS2 domain-containing protein
LAGTARYEVLAHTADTGIIAYGDTLPMVFEHAAYGMFDLMYDLGTLSSGADRRVAASAETTADLLVAWLSELLAVAEIEDLAFWSFTVDRLAEGRVQGSGTGAPAAGLELRGPPVKAVTYHDLTVCHGREGWWARVIFDV